MNNDPVNNPSHYIRDGIECIDAIRAALGPLGFRYYCQGNSIKYSFRAGHKGDASQDFAKSETFARWASEVVVKPDPRLNANCTYSMEGGHTLYGDAKAIGALNNYITESIKLTVEMIVLREVLEGVQRDRIKLTDDIETLRKAREDEREAIDFSDLRYSALLATTIELSKRLDQSKKVPPSAPGPNTPTQDFTATYAKSPLAHDPQKRFTFMPNPRKVYVHLGPAPNDVMVIDKDFPQCFHYGIK